MMMNHNSCSNESTNGHVGSLKKVSRAPHSGGSEGDRVDAVDTTMGHEGSSSTSASTSGLSRINRFADYFVICGLDLDTGLEPDRFSGE